MRQFRYWVVVEAPTKENADEVLVDRLSHDEDLGFDYEILDWDLDVEVDGSPI